MTPGSGGVEGHSGTVAIQDRNKAGEVREDFKERRRERESIKVGGGAVAAAMLWLVVDRGGSLAVEEKSKKIGWREGMTMAWGGGGGGKRVRRGKGGFLGGQRVTETM